MLIRILGTGCMKCQRLEENTRQAVSELGLDAQVEKVTDVAAIMGYGVMRTPALVVDEKVVSTGRALTISEIKALLPEA